jgi:hypothetical protein
MSEQVAEVVAEVEVPVPGAGDGGGDAPHLRSERVQEDGDPDAEEDEAAF